MKSITKAEEQVMMTLWDLGKGLLMEIVDNMPAPQPHKNTVATLLKILVEKEFVSIEHVGRIHKYHPVVSKEIYSKAKLTSVVKGFFQGSFNNIVSFLVDEKKISVADLELLLDQMKKNK